MQMKERMQKVSCEIISYQKIGLAQKNILLGMKNVAPLSVILQCL